MGNSPSGKNEIVLEPTQPKHYEVQEYINEKGGLTRIERPASLVYVHNNNILLWLLLIIFIVVVSMTIEYKFSFVGKAVSKFTNVT